MVGVYSIECITLSTKFAASMLEQRVSALVGPPAFRVLVHTDNFLSVGIVSTCV